MLNSVPEQPREHHLGSEESDLNDLRAVQVHDPLLRSFAGLTGRIVLFGGSFDPIHNGHLHFAKEIQREVGADALVFIPAKQNPMKDHTTGASGAERVEMIRRALIGQEGLYVSPIEVQRCNSAPSYTIDTVREVRERIDSEAELYFLIGADLIPNLHLWKDISEIFALADALITVPRADESGNALLPRDIQNLNPSLLPDQLKKLSDNFVPIRGPSVSSTRIREKFANGGEIDGEVPRVVEDFIREEGLYQDK